MNKKQITDALTKALEEKGKRKFTQSMELIINTRGVNFSKSENRISLDIPLPKGKGGKEQKIAVIAEEEVANQARKAGVDLVILPKDIASYSAPEKLKDLAANYSMLAQPNIMAAVAKSLGHYLGPRGKLPKPIIGDIGGMIKRAKTSVRIVTKGKYMPVLQAFVGTENMEIEDLADNIEAVYDAIKGKVTESNVKSVYLKLTMSKPVKII